MTLSCTYEPRVKQSMKIITCYPLLQSPQLSCHHEGHPPTQRHCCLLADTRHERLAQLQSYDPDEPSSWNVLAQRAQPRMVEHSYEWKGHTAKTLSEPKNRKSGSNPPSMMGWGKQHYNFEVQTSLIILKLVLGLRSGTCDCTLASNHRHELAGYLLLLMRQSDLQLAPHLCGKISKNVCFKFKKCMFTSYDGYYRPRQRFGSRIIHDANLKQQLGIGWKDG